MCGPASVWGVVALLAAHIATQDGFVFPTSGKRPKADTLEPVVAEPVAVGLFTRRRPADVTAVENPSRRHEEAQRRVFGMGRYGEGPSRAEGRPTCGSERLRQPDRRPLAHNMFAAVAVFACLGLIAQPVAAQWDFEDDTECRTPDGVTGSCINIRNCQTILDMLQSAPRPLPRPIVQSLQRYQCGFEGNQPKVCCPPTVPTTPATSPATSPSTVGTSGAPPIPDVTSHANLGLINGDSCGQLITDRIVGGNRTTVMEMPWMTLIAYNTRSGLGFRCGATLINSRYVLTAAHCITNLGTLTLAGVRLGEHNMDTDEDCDIQEQVRVCAPPVQDVAISDVIPHPQYSPTRFENDIGLLRLATPANIDQDHIKPICLPTGTLSRENLARRNLVVAGWGATESGYSSPELLKVFLPFVDNVECANRYNRSRSQVRIGPRQMCAGGVQGRDSCAGDSGGPLLHTQALDGLGDIRYVQHGVVSFGPRNCGSEGLPGVYSRVPYYMDWILDTIRP